MTIETGSKIELIEGFKRIHVNQNAIKKNSKYGSRDPVITVKVYSNAVVKSHNRNVYGSGVYISGSSNFLYKPDDPLSCGAKLWAETWNTVIVYGNEDNEKS